MALRTFLQVLRRHVRLVAAVFLVCVIGSIAATLLATPTYTATAGLFVSVRTADGVDELQVGAEFTRNQMASYASVAMTPTVLGPVAETLDLPGGAKDLAERVEISTPANTVLLNVQVEDTDPARAARTADALAARVIDVVEDLAPSSADTTSSVEATVVRPAETPRNPSSPVLLLNLAAGIVLGAGLGVLAAVAWEALDTRVRGAAHIAGLTGRPVIGTLASDGGRERGVVVQEHPHSPQAEAYRQLRTNLQFLDVGGREPGAPGRGRVLMVTSSVSAEGKSTVAVNLALALAETSQRVLLIDADLRRPTVAGQLGLEGAAGLTTVLVGQASVDDVRQDWGSAGLEVLAAGSRPPNPTELLGSPAMRRLLDELRGEYDHVVLDCPPLLPVADALVLSRTVDGTLLVVNATKARRHQVEESLGALERVDAPLLGVVLNQVARDRSAYDYTAAPIARGTSTGARPSGSPAIPAARPGRVPAGR